MQVSYVDFSPKILTHLMFIKCLNENLYLDI